MARTTDTYISDKDRVLIRSLAKKLAEIANQPEQAEKPAFGKLAMT